MHSLCDRGISHVEICNSSHNLIWPTLTSPQWIRQAHVAVFILEHTLPNPLPDDEQDSCQVERYHEVPNKPSPRRVVCRIQQPQNRSAECGLGQGAGDCGRNLGEQKAKVPVVGVCGEVDGGGYIGGNDAPPSTKQDVVIPPETRCILVATPQAQAKECRGEREEDPYHGLYPSLGGGHFGRLCC